VRGTITFTPSYDVDARAVIASLIATERYQVIERRREAGGGTDRDIETRSHEVFRQDVQLDGPTRFATGQPVTRTFAVTIPVGAPPTFQSKVLGCEWKIDARLDAGGRDPSTDQVIMVVQPASALAAAGDAVAPRTDAVEDEVRYGIWVEPAPLLLGTPFRGVADLSAPIEGDARVELKVHVSASSGSEGAAVALSYIAGTGESGTAETLSIWQGTLGPASAAQGWHRYAFEGVLPANLVPTVELPHGRSRATLEVVVPRRMRPDTRYVREVALATSP
jgi:hypothetical protein